MRSNEQSGKKFHEPAVQTAKRDDIYRRLDDEEHHLMSLGTETSLNQYIGDEKRKHRSVHLYINGIFDVHKIFNVKILNFDSNMETEQTALYVL